MARQTRRQLEAKASAILADPERIKHLGRGKFAVGGDSKKVYVVDMVAKTCECPYFRIYTECKHYVAVSVLVRRKREEQAERRGEGFVNAFAERRAGHAERLKADAERRIAENKARREREAV